MSIILSKVTLKLVSVCPTFVTSYTVDERAEQVPDVAVQVDPIVN